MSSNNNKNNANNKSSTATMHAPTNSTEVAHYVVTAHPPGGVTCMAEGYFVHPSQPSVAIAKSRRLEIRTPNNHNNNDNINNNNNNSNDTEGDDINNNNVATATDSPFPIIISVPIHGRIVLMEPLTMDASSQQKSTTLLFIMTNTFQYAVLGVISNQPSNNPSTSATTTSPTFHTYASGHIRPTLLGKAADSAPLVCTMDRTCIVLHLYDGFLTILPIHPSNMKHPTTSSSSSSSRTTKTSAATTMRSTMPSILGEPYHLRIEESQILDISILYESSSSPSSIAAKSSFSFGPHYQFPLAMLYQSSQGLQHVVAYTMDMKTRQLTLAWKKQRVDGGSSKLISFPSPVTTTTTTTTKNTKTADIGNGGLLVLGQRQITLLRPTTKVIPLPTCMILAYCPLPNSNTNTNTTTLTSTDATTNATISVARFLLGDEFGNLHMLTVGYHQHEDDNDNNSTTTTTINNDAPKNTNHRDNVFLSLDTLGSTTSLSSALVYMDPGWVFIGSTLGDSQLIQLHTEPITDDNGTTYLSVLEEYTNLGPIVDFDWVVPYSSSSSSSSGQDQDHSSTAMTSFQQQNQQQYNTSVITASGSSISGSLRLVRNGIGMKEFAAVELPGIQSMWAVRKQYTDWYDAYLIQSFVAETRILGVVSTNGGEEEASMEDCNNDDDGADDAGGATLEEVILSGLDSTTSSLYVGNIQPADLILQITEREIRLIETSTAAYACVHQWSPQQQEEAETASLMDASMIVVAAANEAGQIVIALRGGRLVYLQVVVDDDITTPTVQVIGKTQMTSEVSCLNLNPFATSKNTTTTTTATTTTPMDTDGRADAEWSFIVTVGLWDDFTVRVVQLDSSMKEVLQIHLSTDDEEEQTGGDSSSSTAAASAMASTTSPVRRNRNNMMARSLCLVTLDSTSNNSEGGVDMLFVGLGDGTLISFAVVHEQRPQQDDAASAATLVSVTVRSKKEVTLGTQRINLIPLQTERGGTCVLATGDRPTVIYLAGGGSRNLTPKLCYSNVNLSTSEEGDNNEDNENNDTQQQGVLSAESIAVNVATPFVSPQLFDDSSLSNKHYSLCVSDDSVLRLGVIDDIQKLHVTTFRLGMAPRRVVHCPEGRLFAVGCIESGIQSVGKKSMDDNNISMGNLVRFLDDTTFDDIERIDLEPHEMILSMASVHLSISFSTPQESSNGDSPTTPTTKPYLLVGTAYALPDEDEPTCGRVLVLSCEDDDSSTRSVKLMTELQVHGGVYSICQFYNGLMLMTVNSKTQVCQLTHDGGNLKLSFLGVGHHGHILSLMVQSRAPKQLADSHNNDDKMDEGPASPKKKKAIVTENTEQLAIVADLMRSISLVQYYPEHKALEEVARDFNTNWTTAIEMLNDNLYLGAENWNNLFVLRRNAKATSEEVRCRLDTVGQFHLGELCNKFMSGSLTMPHSSNTSQGSSTSTAAASTKTSRRKNPVTSPVKGGAKDGATSSTTLRVRRPVVTIGSQTLFATVDGTLGSILGLDARTAAFFTTLERCMAKTLVPVGDFSHQEFRTFDADRRVHPAQGFVDGDLVESFLDLDRITMEAVVLAMNRDGGWEIESHAQKSKDDEEEDDDDEMNVAENTLSVEDILAMVEEMAMFH